MAGRALPVLYVRQWTPADIPALDGAVAAGLTPR